MPRKFFRKYLPSHDSVKQTRHVARFGAFLHHPNLWHLNRHSVAGGVAIGMFSGLVPGPFQMLAAALLRILTKVNLPVALVTLGYLVVHVAWRAHVVRAWRRRALHRRRR